MFLCIKVHRDRNSWYYLSDFRCIFCVIVQFPIFKIISLEGITLKCALCVLNRNFRKSAHLLKLVTYSSTFKKQTFKTGIGHRQNIDFLQTISIIFPSSSSHEVKHVKELHFLISRGKFYFAISYFFGLMG